MTLSSAVLAESGYSRTLTLRTGPAGAVVDLWDIGVAGRDIAVLWEERSGDRRVVRLRTSRDGGRTFRAQRLVDDRGAYFGRTDVCAGYAWVANNFTMLNDPFESPGLVVHGLPLSGAGRSRQVIAEAGGAEEVDTLDFACVGERRRVVGWMDWDGPPVLHVRFLPILPAAEGVTEDDVSLRADPSSAIALAAISDRVWVAWETATRRIRIKAFDIGPAPDFAVTPAGVVTLPEIRQSPTALAVGAAGSRVVVAYSVWTGTYARISTDDGRTFGPRRKLLRGEIADVSWYPSSADVRGRRAVVHAGMSGGMEGEFSTNMSRYRSFDDGRTWSRVRRSTDGGRMGAFSARDGAVRLVEAWDQSTSSRARKWLRFHRELGEHSLE